MKKVMMLVLVLSGCATGKWIKPNSADSNFYKAKSECQIKSKYLHNADYNEFVTQTSTGTNDFNECMKGEGFNYITQE